MLLTLTLPGELPTSVVPEKSFSKMEDVRSKYYSACAIEEHSDLLNSKLTNSKNSSEIVRIRQNLHNVQYYRIAVKWIAWIRQL